MRLNAVRFRVAGRGISDSNAVIMPPTITDVTAPPVCCACWKPGRHAEYDGNRRFAKCVIEWGCRGVWPRDARA